MLLDGALVFDSRKDAPGLVIPHTPMCLFFQQDVGPTSSIPAPDASTPDQVIMHVDWVRYTS